MDGEIVDKIIEKENILDEVENTSLSVGENINVQMEIRKELERKGYTIGKLIDEVLDIAENAYASPRGEGGPDFGKRLKAVELLMEAAGYVKKKGGVEVKFSLSKLLYGNK